MNQYEVYVTVVESGSYASAAKLLYKSPSAISKQITALEQNSNVQLFDRTTRSLSITEAGNIYYEHCKEISARIKTAESELKSVKSELTGNIRITWPSGLAYSEAMVVLGDFSRAYPKITLDIVSSNDVLNLADKSIDIAFRSSPKVDAGLVGIELFSVEPIVCASPEFVSRHSDVKTLKDLANIPNILPSYMNLTQKLRPVFPEISDLKHEEQHRANDTSTIHNMVRNGIGAAFLFKHIVQADLDSGKLVKLFPDVPVPKVPIYLLHRQVNHMPQKMRVFIDFFKRYFLYPDED